MMWQKRARRLGSISMLAVAISFGVGTTGCRTTDSDVQRWANTQRGPTKLVAVLTHDKYDDDLRVAAAMSLVNMRPRAGRQVGIDKLLDGLSVLSPAERLKIVSGMTPILIEGMKLSRPAAAKGDDSATTDPSIPAKDAAFAMLNNEGTHLVEDAASQKALKETMVTWAMTAFTARMDDSTQKYGMEQVLRFLGAQGTKGLPKLIVPDGSKLQAISGLIAELGDQQTKEEASKNLVNVAKDIESAAWTKRVTPKLQKANAQSKIKVKESQFKKQLTRYRQEELMRVFRSMKKVGGAPAVAHLLSYGLDKNQPEQRRAEALNALEGHLDRKNSKQLASILNLAGADDTPDLVRSLALRRVGEMPRKAVINRLYALFRNKNWKIRWVAAELVLKMSESKHMDEFMGQLGKTKGIALSEPLRYGQLLADLKGSPKPEVLVSRFSDPKYPAPARLSAFGYYYYHGNKTQLSKVTPYRRDRQRIPKCGANAKDCEWNCTVGKTTRSVSTVGDFVSYCVIPTMEQREKPKVVVAAATKGKKKK